MRKRQREIDWESEKERANEMKNRNTQRNERSNTIKNYIQTDRNNRKERLKYIFKLLLDIYTPLVF